MHLFFIIVLGILAAHVVMHDPRRVVKFIGQAGMIILLFVLAVAVIFAIDKSVTTTASKASDVVISGKYTKGDYDAVPHELTPGPNGVGYYDGSRFVCVKECR